MKTKTLLQDMASEAELRSGEQQKPKVTMSR